MTVLLLEKNNTDPFFIFLQSFRFLQISIAREGKETVK